MQFSKLWKHQLEAIEYMNSRRCALLQMGIATGKTRTVLEFILQKGFKRILIVGTKNSIYTWAEQTERFSYPFAVGIYDNGSVSYRAKQLDFESAVPTISVINYEATIRKPMLDKLLKLPFDCIVYDECHRLRGHNAKQSKTAYQIARNHPSAYRIGLTGSLIYNRPLDAFGVYRFIDPMVFGVGWTKFKETYAIWRGQYHQIPVKYINQDQLKQLIQDNSFTVERNDVLDLPSEQHIYLGVTLEPKARSIYKEFNKEYVTSIDETIISAKNILDKVNKLQQITSGFVYDKQNTVRVSNAKAETLSELFEEIENHTVVFYKYTATLEILRSIAQKQSIPFYSIASGQSDYRSWLAEPNHKSLLAVQVSAGSEGIDLTKASITVFYDMVYSYGQYIQALGRTSRTNQVSKHVLYYYLVCHDTVDEKIVKALNEKKDLVEYLVATST